MSTLSQERIVTPEEVEEKVVAAVEHALDLDPGQVKPESSLTEDLGAESLDFLDIAFNLEREFNVQLPRLDILQRATDHFGEDTLVKDGVVTERGLDLLRKGMPEIDPARFRPGLKATEVAAMFNVATFVRIILRLLEAKRELPRECPKCGKTMIESEVTPELVCESCDESVPMPTGDEILLRDIISLDTALDR
ncbi:MAG: acyl carrier protein [Acidobacteriota bacterium]